MNQPSDNYIAEMLMKGLGSQFGTVGSTAAGGLVMRETLGRFGIAPTIVDGSGLSRSNRTTPREVVRLLTGMDGTEAAVAFDQSLAVAGRNGTLNKRMRGTVRAGPLPGQDRHAEQRQRAGRLLRHHRRRAGRVRVHHERRLARLGPCAPGPDDGRAGSLRRVRGRPFKSGPSIPGRRREPCAPSLSPLPCS